MAEAIPATPALCCAKIGILCIVEFVRAHLIVRICVIRSLMYVSMCSALWRCCCIEHSMYEGLMQQGL